MPNGDLYSWDISKLRMENLTTSSVPKESLCDKIPSFYVLGPSMSHSRAQKYCQDIGAKMAIMSSNGTIEKIYSDTGYNIMSKELNVWNGYNDMKEVGKCRIRCISCLHGVNHHSLGKCVG